jgi:hypothetical protein
MTPNSVLRGLKKTYLVAVFSMALSLLAQAGSGPGLLAQVQDPPRDFNDSDLKEFGIRAVPQKKDPETGFIVGGKNPTSLIEGLKQINGRSIAELEKDMRPGALSDAGFLGRDEGLLDVMAADNRFVVDESGLTHQELAKHLHAMEAIGARRRKPDKPEAEFTYHGRRYKVEFVYSRGYQDSPFRDGTRHSSNAIVTNVESGAKLRYGLLVPDMIERYGFYEGRGTTYRVEPRQVLEVFDFLKGGKKNKER